MKNNYEGAVIEVRTEEEKQKDYRHEEVELLAAGPSFVEKTIAELPFYEVRNQDGSFTCMNQAYAKKRGILIKKKSGQYVSLSGGYLYRRRANKETAGMGIVDLFNLGKKNGLPFEILDPSQDMTEAEIQNAKEIPFADEVAKIFTDENERFFFLPNDFDVVASTINRGYPVLIMIYANFEEYNINPSIKDPNLTPQHAQIRHGICAHATFKYKGVDYILVDDSWGILDSEAHGDFEEELKQRGQRMVTREWFNKRVYGAGYIRDLKFAWDDGSDYQPTKPKFTFTRTLKWGMLNDPEVAALQDVLKYEGLFPIDQTSTGNFYGLTMDAVKAFQKKYNIVSSGSPETTGYGQVGSKTRAVLNSLYST